VAGRCGLGYATARDRMLYSPTFRIAAGLNRNFRKKQIDMPELSSTIRNSAKLPKRDLGEMFKTKKTRPVILPTEERYTSNEVSKISGVSLRQLQWWDERKVVSPRQDGHKRVYMPQEVVEISVIAELRRKGFSLQKIRRVLKYLQKEMSKRLDDAISSESEIHLLTDGKSIFLEETPDRIIDLLKSARQPMFLVCVTDQIRRFGVPLRKPAKSETAGAVRKTRAL
jgi:DNA-binding transcriptional MerR regulator